MSAFYCGWGERIVTGFVEGLWQTTDTYARMARKKRPAPHWPPGKPFDGKEALNRGSMVSICIVLNKLIAHIPLLLISLVTWHSGTSYVRVSVGLMTEMRICCTSNYFRDVPGWLSTYPFRYHARGDHFCIAEICSRGFILRPLWLVVEWNDEANKPRSKLVERKIYSVQVLTVKTITNHYNGSRVTRPNLNVRCQRKRTEGNNDAAAGCPQRWTCLFHISNKNTDLEDRFDLGISIS